MTVSNGVSALIAFEVASFLHYL